MANMQLTKTPMAEQDPQVRNQNFLEVAQGYTLEEAMNEAKRCIHCKNPACVSGCPVGIPIPEFLDQVAQGNIAAAYEILSNANALPAISGRVCPQENQCEGKCVRGIKGEPVAIGRVERFVADWAAQQGVANTATAPKNGRKVAVIGSGPAGLTIAIVRDDLIGFCPEDAPTMLNYKTHADNDSCFNTPPTFAIYMAGLVFQWMLKNGGVEAIQKVNEEKAAILYDCIDNSSLYTGTVTNKAQRSLMNVPFVLPNEELTAKFIKESTAAGLVSLKGHRSVGGIRASIYNAMPVEGVKALVAFMKKFEMENK